MTILDLLRYHIFVNPYDGNPLLKRLRKSDLKDKEPGYESNGGFSFLFFFNPPKCIFGAASKESKF